MRSVLMAAGLAGTLVLAGVAQTRPPANCEVRTFKDTFTNETSTSLTLTLAGRQGPVPISTSVTVVQRALGGSPQRARFDADYTLYNGLPSFRVPHLEMTLDKELKTETTLTFRVNPNVPLESVKRVSLPATFNELLKIARAESVEGRIFGLEFHLTPTQLNCFKDFLARF